MKIKKYVCLVLTSLLLSIGFIPAIKAEGEETKTLLHFVQITDTHLQKEGSKDAERLLGSSEKLLKAAVEEINKIENLDFVLSTGDQVDTAEEELIEKYINITMSLKAPLYVLLGNHDVSVNGGLKKDGYIKKFTSTKNQKSFTDNMAYYSFSPNDKFTFICLDGTTDKVVTPHGQIQDSKQFEWLEGKLEANKDKFVIIALHFPLIEPFKSQTHFFLEPDRTRLLDLLNGYKNVLGIFTGHYHAARLQKIKNIIHNSGPAVVQWPNAFREIIITQDEPKYLNFHFKWHPVNGEDTRNISKNNSKSWSLTQGAEEDRESIVKVRVY